MKNNFLMRGYPEKLLHTKMTEARKKQHNELLNKTTQKKNTTEDQNEIFMIATFRPCKNSLTATVKQNWDLLGRSKTTKNIHRSKLTTNFKRPKNLKDILTRARPNYTDIVETSVTNTENKNICTTKNCKYCSMLDTSGKLHNENTNQTHTTKHNITCNSSNLIYCIKCKKCNMQYVGQTKRKIKERTREHMYHTTKGIYNSDVPYHFNSEGHFGTNDMKVYILDFIYEHPDSKRAGSL